MYSPQSEASRILKHVLHQQNTCICIKSSANGKIMEQPKLKAIAEENQMCLNCLNSGFCILWVGNVAGKWQKTCYQHFLLFLYCFDFLKPPF